MEIGFDKEIDAILRKARGAEAATSAGTHLDADDISAFAENALPDAARQRFTAHLADCTRCRKILSNVTALNSEAETETAFSVAPAKIAEAKTPWYRKLFVFPQVAYTMGALVVLFGGLLGFLVLQNLTGSRGGEVSFSTDKQAPMEKPAAQPAANVSSSSNTAIAPANSSAIANATAPTGSAPVSSANTAAANTLANMPPAPTERKPSEQPESSIPSVNQPMVMPQATPQDKISREEDADLAKTETKNEANKPITGGVSIQEENKRKDKKSNKEAYSKDDQAVTDAAAEPRLKTTRSVPSNPKKLESEAGKSRSVGGKTFNNVGGIWFDAAYTNQKQKTVNRGTNDYQKLDSGLRSIADQFSGTVVILWKSKAYRIQ